MKCHKIESEKLIIKLFLHLLFLLIDYIQVQVLLSAMKMIVQEFILGEICNISINDVVID